MRHFLAAVGAATDGFVFVTVVLVCQASESLGAGDIHPGARDTSILLNYLVAEVTSDVCPQS